MSIKRIEELVDNMKSIYSPEHDSHIKSLCDYIEQVYDKMQSVSIEKFHKYLIENSKGLESNVPAKKLYEEYMKVCNCNISYRDFNKAMKTKYSFNGSSYFVPYNNIIHEFVTSNYLNMPKRIEVSFNDICDNYISIYNTAPNKLLFGKELNKYFLSRKSNGKVIYTMGV